MGLLGFCRMRDFAYDYGQLAIVQLLAISMHVDLFFDYYGFITLVLSLALGFLICACEKKNAGNTGSFPLPKSVHIVPQTAAAVCDVD